MAASVTSRVRIRVPKGTRSSCRSSSRSRPSPERTTVNSDVASKSALERIRSSPRTSGLISWASSIKSTGRIREEATCAFQRSRSALNPHQRLCGASFTAKMSPSSR